MEDLRAFVLRSASLDPQADVSPLAPTAGSVASLFQALPAELHPPDSESVRPSSFFRILILHIFPSPSLPQVIIECRGERWH